MFTIQYHEFGRPNGPVRSEVEVTAGTAGSRDRNNLAVQIVWSVKDDRMIKLVVKDINYAETAAMLLEAYLKAECMWDDRAGRKGMLALLDAIDDQGDDSAERLSEHNELTF
jgi:hypothetical protein